MFWTVGVVVDASVLVSVVSFICCFNNKLFIWFIRWYLFKYLCLALKTKIIKLLIIFMLSNFTIFLCILIPIDFFDVLCRINIIVYIKTTFYQLWTFVDEKLSSGTDIKTIVFWNVAAYCLTVFYDWNWDIGIDVNHTCIYMYIYYSAYWYIPILKYSASWLVPILILKCSFKIFNI